MTISGHSSAACVLSGFASRKAPAGSVTDERIRETTLGLHPGIERHSVIRFSRQQTRRTES